MSGDGLIAVAARVRGAAMGVRVIDARAPDMTFLFLTTAEWRQLLPKIEAALTVAEGQHPAQTGGRNEP